MTKRNPDRGLTAKQRRFTEEYQIDQNASQAAVRAGYSEKTAAVIGAENLRKPAIAEVIAAAQKELSARSEISADMVIGELRTIALGESELTRDKLRALELLGKCLGMFVDRSVSATLDIGPGGMGATAELIASIGKPASPQDPLRLSS
jgi:phage terminase small subunit